MDAMLASTSSSPWRLASSRPSTRHAHELNRMQEARVTTQRRPLRATKSASHAALATTEVMPQTMGSTTSITAGWSGLNAPTMEPMLMRVCTAMAPTPAPTRRLWGRWHA